MKRLKCYKYLVFLIVLGLAESLVLARTGQAPVLTHEYRSDIPSLLEIAALEADLVRISSPDEAESKHRDLLRRLDQLRPQVNPPPNMLKQAYRQAAGVVHFYLINRDLENADSRLLQARDWLVDYAQRYRRQTKDKRDAITAHYYELVGQYGREEGRGQTVTQLVDMKESLAQQKTLAANIDMLLAYSLVLVPATRQQGLQDLNKIPPTSVYSKIAIRLIRALAEAGLDENGNAIQNPSASALKKLRYVVQIARGLPGGAQTYVLNTAFFIWQQAFQSRQEPLPFDTDGFAGIKPVQAFRERQALSLLQAARFKEAIGIYDEITQAYSGQPVAIDLARRAWQLEWQSHRQNPRYRALEARFNRLHQRYVNPQSKNQDFVQKAKTFYKAARSQYRRFIIGSLAAVIAKPNRAGASQVQSMAESFLRYKMSRREGYAIKIRLARVYRQSQQLAKAVSTYMDLARDTPVKALQGAAEAQSQLANWPVQPPWQQVPQGPKDERQKLISIYEQLARLQKESDWSLLAHIGLLYRGLGRDRLAETFWLQRLGKAPPTKHANEVVGQLAQAFFNSKRWPKLIQLARVARSQKFQPTFKLKSMPLAPLYAQALLTQGQITLNSGRFNESIGFYNEFIRFFPQDNRITNAYFNLANAYKGVGRIIQALNAMKILIDKFPSLPWRKQVLLQGGQWAANNQKTMEYAFFFYGKYLQEFSNEPNIPQIREMLAGLYFKAQLYGWAARLYREQSVAASVPKPMQIAAALRFLEIEERFGQPKEAVFGAERVLSLVAPNSAEAATANSFLARYAASRGDLAAMRQLEPKLISIAKNHSVAKQALGQIRFKMAEMLTKPISNQEANAFLKNPEGAVKKYFSQYQQQRVHYAKVCQNGMSTFCAPSQLRLVQLVRMAKTAIDKVEIADTLAQNRVNAFRVFKQLHMGKLKKQENQFSREALRLAKQGTTTNLWQSEIIKSLGGTRLGSAH
jgi:tetratricopeptide (TPR) repeat protein